MDHGIADGLRLLHDTGSVFEIRVLDCPDRLGSNYRRNLTGYFDDPDAAEIAVQSIEKLQPAAIYVTVNPVDRDCLARCANRMAGKIPSTQDTDIARRRWIFIDIDAKRKSGISSTNEELNKAKEVAKNVEVFLRESFHVLPMVACSGNGWHLLVKIDMENNEDSKKKVEAFLKYLNGKFSNDHAAIDTSVGNAARITRVYGTVARKGENTADRPHRQSQIVQVASGIISEELLDAFLEEEVGEVATSTVLSSSGTTFDLENWLSKHSVAISSRIRTPTSTKFYFADKPGICGDHDWKVGCKDAYIELKDSGAIIAKCSHNRCGWTWQDFRQFHEPDAYDKREGSEILDVDFSAILRSTSKETISDEEFCLNKVPATGLMRETFSHYMKIANKPNPVLGLAVAVTMAETLIGRRVVAHTGQSTNPGQVGSVICPNDYNVVIAPSGGGKQAVIDSVKQILNAAEAHSLIIPDDIKSDSALMKVMAEKKAGVWICDEVGRVLTSIFDSRESNHRTQIGTRLLTYYTDSTGVFEGSISLTGGQLGRVVRPFLALLGCTTQDSLFGSAMGQRELSEGHINRFAFWPISEGGKPITPAGGEVDESLKSTVSRWFKFRSDLFATEDALPNEYVIRFTHDACLLWEQYRDEIAERSQTEFENRSVIWQRVAHRAAKLALAHRCARLSGPEELNEFSSVCVESSDIQWAMELSTWLARITCDLVENTIQDHRLHKLEAKIREVLWDQGKVSLRDLCRKCRAYSGNNVRALLKVMASKNILEVCEEVGASGRPSEWVKLKVVDVGK